MSTRRFVSRGLGALRRPALIALALLAPAATVVAQPLLPILKVDADGAVHADRVTVQPSNLMSPQARAYLVERLAGPPMQMGQGVKGIRDATDVMGRQVVSKWLAIYPSNIESTMINGVRTDVVTPKGGVAPGNLHRVLINLHGGGFFTGGGGPGGQSEAIPLAGRGRIKVVAVDYRLTPEHKFPDASEDVAQVYRALLKSYKPGEIGIYGCSAGGALVGQSLAWFQAHHLPKPGAAGMFCAGAMPSFWYGGDSASVAPILNAQPALGAGPKDFDPGAPYLAGLDKHDPLITPGLFPKVLAQFPPTLMISGTRDVALSNVLTTNARLLAAGVQTQLFVQEGIGHGEFTTAVGSPEATQAYDVIWRFFDSHLAR